MATQSASNLREQLDRHLASRDRLGAVEAATGAVRDGLIGVEDLYTHVLAPLLRDIGATWQSGKTAVWEEHYASATVRTIIEGLYLEVAAQAKAAPSLGKIAVLACPPGEMHDLGLRMLTDRLSLHGWTTHFLGADTPTDQIVSAAESLDASLVVLSAATHYNRTLLRSVVDKLRASLPDVRVGVGGPAFTAERGWPADELLTESELGLGPDVDFSGE